MVKNNNIVELAEDYGVVVKEIAKTPKTSTKKVATRRDRIQDNARGTGYVGAVRRENAKRKREERKATEGKNRTAARKLKKENEHEAVVEPVVITPEAEQQYEKTDFFTEEEKTTLANEMIEKSKK